MLTFAYGSNMDPDQMQERCPSMQFVCIAVLREHHLDFSRKSIKRRCGVADVVPSLNSHVWGVVYEITKQDLEALDENEGYRPNRPPQRNAYNRRTRIVFQDGDETKPLNVEIYFAVPQENSPLPNQEYKDLIMCGARYWNLPADYIAELEKIRVAS